MQFVHNINQQQHKLLSLSTTEKGTLIQTVGTQTTHVHLDQCRTNQCRSSRPDEKHLCKQYSESEHGCYQQMHDAKVGARAHLIICSTRKQTPKQSGVSVSSVSVLFAPNMSRPTLEDVCKIVWRRKSQQKNASGAAIYTIHY